jgi:hypothetical protein
MDKPGQTEKIHRICDFCFEKQEDLVNTICPACGYPMKGSQQEQQQFKAAHVKEKQKIDEAETSLSQARYAMLWPSLAAIVLNFIFDFPPQNMYVFAATLGFYAVFVGAYFVVAWRPLPILLLTSMFLLSGMIFAFSTNMIQNRLLIVPGIILLIYSNAIYSTWRAEKVVDGMRAF